MKEKIVFNFFDKADTLNSLCELYKLNSKEVTKFISNHQNIDTMVSDFIKYFGIKLDSYEVDHVFLRCKHVTTSFDNLQSLKKWGLLNLNKTLFYETSLSTFLKEHSVKINVNDKFMVFNEHKVSLFEYHEDCHECIYGECKYIRRQYDGTHDISYKNIWCNFRINLIPLIVKLYSHKSEIEVHLSGNDERILNYSVVSQYPEIFITIQKVLYSLFNDAPKLITNWLKKENKKTYIVQFDEQMSSFEWINTSSVFEGTIYPSDILELCGKTLEDFESDNINNCFFSNYYLITKSIYIISENSREFYGQIFPEIEIGWDRLFIQEV